MHAVDVATVHENFDHIPNEAANYQEAKNGREHLSQSSNSTPKFIQNKRVP